MYRPQRSVKKMTLPVSFPLPLRDVKKDLVFFSTCALFPVGKKKRQTQDLVYTLQAESEKLRCDRKDTAYTKKEILQLQETLDKEKKLTSDLRCATTKLKELLKVTQEQLSKEREAVMKLQEQFQKMVLECLLFYYIKVHLPTLDGLNDGVYTISGFLCTELNTRGKRAIIDQDSLWSVFLLTSSTFYVMIMEMEMCYKNTEK